MTEKLGRGNVVSGTGVEGTLRRANAVPEVFALMREPNLEEVILLTDSPAATAVVPLLSKVRGIVCCSGGMTSHLAIVSRELGLSCVMGAELPDADTLDGVRILIDGEGTISRA
jgi:phosphohistidine swiveling domain-containing protein